MKNKPRKIRVTFSIDERAELTLRKGADIRGISLQELLRAVVLPEWVMSHGVPLCDPDPKLQKPPTLTSFVQDLIPHKG